MNIIFIFLIIPPLIFCNCDKLFNRTPVITQGIYYSPIILDPAKINDDVTSQIIPHIVETLVKYDQQSDSLIPFIAKYWKVDRTKKRYIFKIKEGILFHDSYDTLAAHDIAFSFLRQFDKSNPFYSDKTPNLFEEFYRNIIENIKVVNDYEIIFNLKHPNILFLHILSSPFCAGIISKDSFDISKSERLSAPMGTGPYYFDKKNADGNIHLKAFDRYHNSSPIIKNVIFLAKKRSQSENLALRNSIDVLYQIRGNMVEKFRLSKSLSIHIEPALSTFYLGFNLRAEAVSDKLIRKYIESAIDKSKVISILNRTNVEISHGPLPRGLWNVDIQQKREKEDPISKPSEINLSKYMLRVIGYAPNERVRFFYNVIIKHIKDLNVSVKEDYYSDWESYFKEREKGNYHMFFSTWHSDFLGDPYFFLYNLFHSQSANNTFHYKSASVDSLLDMACVTESRNQRYKIYPRILDIIKEDLPAIFIHHPRKVFVANKRFSPIIIDPYGYIHFEKIKKY